MQHKVQRHTAAFTLIELLVVIAIIALLIGILLPALGTARSVARSLVDQTQIRSIAQSQAAYMSANDDAYSCITTTGWKGHVPRANAGDTLYTGNTTEVTPVTTSDFISPIMGEELGFASTRADRMAGILNGFADPAARALNNELHGTAPDRDEFDVVAERDGFTQVSYLMPGAFASWGTASTGTFVPGQGLTGNDIERYRKLYGAAPMTWNGGPAGSVETPRGFRNKLFQVGSSASTKIIVADGTRFLDGNILDFDISTTSDIAIATFASGTPQWKHNTAYGPDQLHGGSPLNLELSFRHPNQSLNAGFFDGHTENLKQKEVWTDMSKWAPSGSVAIDSGISGLTEEAQNWVQNLKQGQLGGTSGYILP